MRDDRVLAGWGLSCQLLSELDIIANDDLFEILPIRPIDVLLEVVGLEPVLGCHRNFPQHLHLNKNGEGYFLHESLELGVFQGAQMSIYIDQKPAILQLGHNRGLGGILGINNKVVGIHFLGFVRDVLVGGVNSVVVAWDLDDLWHFDFFLEALYEILGKRPLVVEYEVWPCALRKVYLQALDDEVFVLIGDWDIGVEQFFNGGVEDLIVELGLYFVLEGGVAVD